MCRKVILCLLLYAIGRGKRSLFCFVTKGGVVLFISPLIMVVGVPQIASDVFLSSMFMLQLCRRMYFM